jgi:hypothetical protein
MLSECADIKTSPGNRSANPKVSKAKGVGGPDTGKVDTEQAGKARISELPASYEGGTILPRLRGHPLSPGPLS